MAAQDRHGVGLRPLGNSTLKVSPVAMGCWPIAGMTSLEVNETDSVATLEAAFDAGVNFFDTAFCYGMNGESERLIHRALGDRREEIVIATKGGLHWDQDGKRVIDGRPETLVRQCEESLRRLNTTYVDLLYLHAPDPDTPLDESAAALKRLMDSGKANSIGVSNLSLEQLTAFHKVCPITAHQPPYNMLQRQIEGGVLEWCVQQRVATVVYWPLMKGLLAGKLFRSHSFDRRDGRAKYPMFQGEEWRKNQDFVDELRLLAAESQRSVAQLVVAWTISQPGITSALCGAKRPTQILETASAMNAPLSPREHAAIIAALSRRGEAVVTTAI